MMVDPGSKEMSYTSVAFPESVNQKPFQAKRRNTKYAEITAVLMTNETNTEQVPVPIPRSRSLDRRDNPSLVNNPEPDVPPVPIRVESQEDKLHDTQTSPIIVEPFQAPSSDSGKADPFGADPFASDPFTSSTEEWRDSTAFYDTPPPPRPYVPGMSVPKAPTPEPEGETNETKSDGETADCTDESSYQETREFLQDVQAKYRSENPRHTSPPKQQNESNPLFAPASEVFVADSKPPPRAEPGTKDGSTTKLSAPYDYPGVLDKFPKKPEDPPLPPKETSVPSHPLPDEPPLHTMTYSKGGPGGSGLTRHESISRRTMPLPPLPKEGPPSGSGLLSPPPLPARPAATFSTTQPPTFSATTQPPALPPFNHPWGNKKSKSEESNPPLPPRRKEPQPPSYNGAPAPAPTELPPKTAPEKNLAVSELQALGYSMSEIERALLVSRNDVTLAKLILKEFGGKH